MNAVEDTLLSAGLSHPQQVNFMMIRNPGQCRDRHSDKNLVNTTDGKLLLGDALLHGTFVFKLTYSSFRNLYEYIIYPFCGASGPFQPAHAELNDMFE